MALFHFLTFHTKLQWVQKHLFITGPYIGFIRARGGEFRHLVLFDNGLVDKICDKIKYLMREKRGITDNINRNFGKIIIDSFNSLPIEKILTFHNVIILIKSVANKKKND